VFVVAGAALLAAGLVQSAGEIAPYFSGGFGAAQRFAAVVSGTYKPGASLSSKAIFFADCLAVAVSLFAKAQPPTRRLAFEQHCHDAARVTAAEMPTYSDAWLVLASTSVALDDPEGFRRGLVASHTVAADVRWLSAQRVALAAPNADLLDDPTRTVYRADLTSLFDSDGGAEVLAARYLANRDEQELILEVGETLPSAFQKRFLNKVRELKAEQQGVQ
jgi:hypothetical protein